MTPRRSLIGPFQICDLEEQYVGHEQYLQSQGSANHPQWNASLFD